MRFMTLILGRCTWGRIHVWDHLQVVVDLNEGDRVLVKPLFWVSIDNLQSSLQLELSRVLSIERSKILQWRTHLNQRYHMPLLLQAHKIHFTLMAKVQSRYIHKMNSTLLVVKCLLSSRRSWLPRNLSSGIKIKDHPKRHSEHSCQRLAQDSQDVLKFK